MKWFQLRVIHRCLGTNVILKEIGVLNSDLCSFCNTTKDSIRHMFWQCAIIQRFWQELTDTMNEKCQNAYNLHITEPLAILGLDKNIQIDSTFYFIMLLAKQYVYKCKLARNIPVLQAFFVTLKYRYIIEEYIARKFVIHNDFTTRWYPYNALIADASYILKDVLIVKLLFVYIHRMSSLRPSPIA
eukprot:TRINITY_DN10718_c0_g1_i6.p1 TRINITY_DN10718_c0_g1~~TRINITY_DN10718_c0_g1_i6.p1  ORF type:complete len:186 (+),score=5.76 TRINITY_DN10718_c0_g1_i6:129-686(+)